MIRRGAFEGLEGMAYRIVGFLIAIVCMSGGVEVLGAEKAELTLWATGPMTRIFPFDNPPEGARGEYTLKAARGETECFQIGVRTEGFRMERLWAEATDLAGPGGAVIPAANIEILHAEYVPVKWAASAQKVGDVEREAPAFFPDPLVPEWQWITAGPEPPPARSIWVRVTVPRDAAPGGYTGALKVSAGRKGEAAENVAAAETLQLDGEITLKVEVWDFEIPAASSLYMTNWFTPYEVAEWYEVAPWHDEHWALIEMFARDMAAHRQNVILTPILALVRVSRDGEGFAYDFERFDRWCEIFFDAGFALIEGGHVGYGPRTVHVMGRGRGWEPLELAGVEDAAHAEFFTGFFRALWAHLGEKGWRERYIQHIGDEPNQVDVAKYRRMRELMREAAPGMKTIDALNEPGFAGETDIPVPIESMYDELIAESGRSPGDVWVYYCCGPTGHWPNRFIEYTLIRVRIFSWLCFAKGIPGFLHWGYNQWGTNPRNRKTVLNPWDDVTGHRWPGGDPQVVYPPRDEKMTRDEVIGSIRWEIIREAMEDYEYLRMTREKADAGDARAKALIDEIMEKAAPDWTTHTRDPEYLMSLRERMGEILSR